MSSVAITQGNGSTVTVEGGNIVVAGGPASLVTIARTGSQGPTGPIGRSGMGFRRYTSAAYSELSPIVLPAGVATAIPLAADGSDPASYYQGAYAGLNAVSGGEFRSLAVGETFLLRLLMQGKSSVMNNRLIVRMNIGGAVGNIDHDWDEFPYSAGEVGAMTFKFTGYALDTFLANGAQMIATADQDAWVWAPMLLHLPMSVPE